MSTQGCVMMYVTSNPLEPGSDAFTLSRSPPGRTVVTMDAIGRLQPPLRAGERVTLRLERPTRDLVGFVTAVQPLTLEDRHGRLHSVVDETVTALRRVGPALGRDPLQAPRELLDELAARTGVTGEPTVHRISVLLHGSQPPETVFAERGEWRAGAIRARVEGEWLTTNAGDPGLLVALCWWATRQNARSVLVCADTPEGSP